MIPGLKDTQMRQAWVCVCVRTHGCPHLCVCVSILYASIPFQCDGVLLFRFIYRVSVGVYV